MKSVISVSKTKLTNDDKYLVSFHFKDRLVIKKINILKNIQDTEENSGFKPPLFLIGIGMALIYQLFFRPNNKKSEGGSSFNKKRGTGKMTSKNLNDMYKYGRPTTR